MVCTCAAKTLITPYPHLPPAQDYWMVEYQDYWMVEYQGHWMLQGHLNKVMKQQTPCHIVKFLQQGYTKVNRMLPETS